MHICVCACCKLSSYIIYLYAVGAQVLTSRVVYSTLSLLDQDRSLCPLVKPPLQYWSMYWLNQFKSYQIVRSKKTLPVNKRQLT